MVNIFISIILAIEGFMIFTISFQINGVNRVFVNTPKSIFEVSIPVVAEDEFNPYFKKETLNKYLTYYYNKTILMYVDSYEINYYYYNLDDHSMCLTNYPKAVEVTLTCETAFSYQYTKTIFYEIRSNINE